MEKCLEGADFIQNFTAEIITKAEEERDRFIFETILPYANQITQLVLDKRELERIINRGLNEELKPVIHAKWIMPDEGYDPKRWRKCSSCGRHIKLYEDYTDFAGNDNLFRIQADYCIRCGARMDYEGD